MCEISSSICTSPIGLLSLTYCSKGLHFIGQIKSINDESFLPDENQTVEIQSWHGKLTMPESCLNWLRTYFHTPKKLTKTPELCPNVASEKGSFQESVWRALLDNVHFGQTITYGQLAELAGNKKAARAAGTAMLRNPFQIIVPCHRVIRSNGDIGNYSGGTRNLVKLWLLKHEKQ
ncbi:unnamed protein product [Rotaria magnacalcarata]|uniref:Methylated-DNA--protein-cysteine methyltransferase n=1 Tax=Rotaria magnacalcarata TaxID=392030 RepID=A0A816QEM1_9BILA|nr:unnamed protein product [Rotaria magnacalcarata]CAF1662959.1 unnamed protein product [Rotaria magnacalcarata]CAF2038885.1 unnamed protein product [Rotaria magnacalcarata]CAF2059056.1 unnamed protein product [Rotaria magnacalcarata]CAF2190119.1 unnamed protein product [Rotaria magnacalcarata]